MWYMDKVNYNNFGTHMKDTVIRHRDLNEIQKFRKNRES